MKHKHYDLIVQWADGAKIQQLAHGGVWYAGPLDFTPHEDMWKDIEKPTWGDEFYYRVAPEKKYPKSTLDYTALCNIVCRSHSVRVSKKLGEGIETIIARFAADVAIKHFIKSGEMDKYLKENK